jgi:hypothetical protein
MEELTLGKRRTRLVISSSANTGPKAALMQQKMAVAFIASVPTQGAAFLAFPALS